MAIGQITYQFWIELRPIRWKSKWDKKNSEFKLFVFILICWRCSFLSFKNYYYYIQYHYSSVKLPLEFYISMAMNNWTFKFSSSHLILSGINLLSLFIYVLCVCQDSRHSHVFSLIFFSFFSFRFGWQSMRWHLSLIGYVTYISSPSSPHHEHVSLNLL